jgi:hypothetical protein
MKKFAAAAGPSITLVVALVMLFASLAAFLLANSLRGQLEETRGQLEDAQSELPKTPSAKDQQQKTDKGGAVPTGGQPGTVVNKSQPQDNTKNPQDSKSSTRQGQDNSK